MGPVSLKQAPFIFERSSYCPLYQMGKIGRGRGDRDECLVYSAKLSSAVECRLHCPANVRSLRALFCFVAFEYRLVGIVVKAFSSREEDPGFESSLRRDSFRGRVIPVTSKLALQWLPCQAPGVKGSALGLVGPVSVYCDWVRWKV